MRWAFGSSDPHRAQRVEPREAPAQRVVVHRRRRLKGEVITPPDTRPAPCYPSRPTEQCWGCGRHCSGELPSEWTVRIDPTAIGAAEPCALYVARWQQ